MAVFVGVVLLIFFVVSIGKVCGRLLGVRLGAVRGVLVGFIGWLVGVAAAYATIGRNGRGGLHLEVSTFGDWIDAVATIVFFGVLAAMPVAIALDLLTRRGSAMSRRHRRRWLWHPLRSVRTAWAPYGRLREIIGRARRVGLISLRFRSRSALDSPELAVRVRTVLEDSGGMMVKLGQIASTRSDVLPAELIDELAKLRADVRPVAADEVRTVLETELGRPVADIFASFQWQPLAAASIGQTHLAVLPDGQDVVVKVQRPGIAETVARDAAALRLVARQLDRRVEGAHAIGIQRVVEETINGLEDELRYRLEAALGSQLRENRAKDQGIAIPRVYSDISTDRVLVMERVVGRTVADDAAMDAAPIGRAEIAQRVLTSFMGQILTDGLFHADPHPGNLLIDTAGVVWLLDFGSVGRLDPIAMEGLRGIALGIATKDPAVLARAARDLAAADGAPDLRSLQADLGAQLTQGATGGGFDAATIGKVLAVLERHEMTPPASITLLARSLLTLEGTIRLMAPDLNIADASSTMVATQREAIFGSPREVLQKEVLRSLPSLRTLPDHAETLANQLRVGRMTVRTERYSGSDRHVMDEWVDRAVLAAAGGLGAVTSALLLIAASATSDDRVRAALWILGFAGLSFAAVLLSRSVARALRRSSNRRQ